HGLRDAVGGPVRSHVTRRVGPARRSPPPGDLEGPHRRGQRRRPRAGTARDHGGGGPGGGWPPPVTVKRRRRPSFFWTLTNGPLLLSTPSLRKSKAGNQRSSSTVEQLGRDLEILLELITPRLAILVPGAQDRRRVDGDNRL